MTNESERDDALRIIREIASGIFHDNHIRDEVAAALGKAADILERESETCKFNCRDTRSAYILGYGDSLVESAGFEPNDWEIEAAAAWGERNS